MQCIRPIKASQNNDGDIVYSSKKATPGLVGFQFECRKCLPCRLNIAREKATRAVHEAKMHEDNIFLTLTYKPESLNSQWLIYEDFQNFMKRLRYTENRDKYNPITYMVTGEYGDENKRPHWHALIFNYRPEDATKLYTTDRGDTLFTSKTLETLWPHGKHDFGEITMDSAGYVARYAAKKLVHGKDQDHDYHPIHKTSSRRAIGRSWIEKNFKHVFAMGCITLQDGQKLKIPRYYLDWCKKHEPETYRKYVTTKRQDIIDTVVKKNRKEEIEYISACLNKKGGVGPPRPRNQVKLTILESKFKKLQENLKL